MPLSKTDLTHLGSLFIKQRLTEKPSYGSAGLYTLGHGGWAPPLAPHMLIDQVAAISGEGVGSMADWMFNATKEGFRKDAEVQLVDHYNRSLIQQTGNDPTGELLGTLYFALDKAPCTSCRHLIKALQTYWNFRMVIAYKDVLGKTYNVARAGGKVSQYGYDDATEAKVNEGTTFVKILERSE